MQQLLTRQPPIGVIMLQESHKLRSDADLERLFPEHEWRKPLPLKFMEVVNNRRVVRPFGCAFCVYRYGLDPGGAHRFSSEAAARSHIEKSHA